MEGGGAGVLSVEAGSLGGIVVGRLKFHPRGDESIVMLGADRGQLGGVDVVVEEVDCQVLDGFAV